MTTPRSKKVIMLDEERLTKREAERLVERVADVFYDLGWDTPEQYGKAQELLEKELQDNKDTGGKFFAENMRLLIQTAGDLEDAASGRG